VRRWTIYCCPKCGDDIALTHPGEEAAVTWLLREPALIPDAIALAIFIAFLIRTRRR
jgi:hypothetical protein